MTGWVRDPLKTIAFKNNSARFCKYLVNIHGMDQKKFKGRKAKIMIFKSDYGAYDEDDDWVKNMVPEITEVKRMLKEHCDDLFDWQENGDDFKRLVDHQHEKVDIVCIMTNSLFRPTNDAALDGILEHCYKNCHIVLIEDLECAAK